MNEIFDNTVIWWITAVELPVLSALFWLMHKNKKESDKGIAALREGLMDFKLEVAKSYASITDVKDLEVRLVGHLLRIEAKLDRTALKAEALRKEKP